MRSWRTRRLHAKCSGGRSRSCATPTTKTMPQSSRGGSPIRRPRSSRLWVTQPGNSVLLAVEGDAVLGVGSITDLGEITLNYVSPDARFQGVSRALLHALEARAAERANTRCKLMSTQTARRFYLSAGYIEDGAPSMMFGTSSYPMSKWLRSPPIPSR